MALGLSPSQSISDVHGERTAAVLSEISRLIVETTIERRDSFG